MTELQTERPEYKESKMYEYMVFGVAHRIAPLPLDACSANGIICLQTIFVSNRVYKG